MQRTEFLLWSSFDFLTLFLTPTTWGMLIDKIWYSLKLMGPLFSGTHDTGRGEWLHLCPVLLKVYYNGSKALVTGDILSA